MWQELANLVRTEHARFDRWTRSWLADLSGKGGRIHCRRGCRNCCALMVNATFAEAFVVAAALTDRQSAAMAGHAGKILAAAEGVGDFRGWLRAYRQSIGFCPLLEPGGACGVYQHRPLSCRALLSTRMGDWCAVDLSELHPLEKQAFLSGLDPSVVAWPSHYAAMPLDVGRRFEAGIADRMIETFGFSVAGNLPLLVWLERNMGLSALFPKGAVSVAGALAKAGVKHPFLIDLRMAPDG